MLIAKIVSKKKKGKEDVGKKKKKKKVRIKISPFTRGWSVSTLVSYM